MDIVTLPLLVGLAYMIKIHFFEERRIADLLDDALTPIEIKPQSYQSRIEENQRKLIDKRLGLQETSVWTKFDSAVLDKNYGVISLAVNYNRHRNEPLVPMPSMIKNREYLEKLSFVISDDQLWATFREPSDARLSEG